MQGGTCQGKGHAPTLRRAAKARQARARKRFTFVNARARCLRLAWRMVIYRCPYTGKMVQAFIDHPMDAPANAETFEPYIAPRVSASTSFPRLEKWCRRVDRP